MMLVPDGNVKKRNPISQIGHQLDNKKFGFVTIIDAAVNSDGIVGQYRFQGINFRSRSADPMSPKGLELS